MNFGALVEAVAARTDLSRSDARLAAQAVLDVIGGAVAEGKAVKLTNFGTFLPRLHRMLPGQLGGRITEPGTTRVVGFRMSGRLADAVRAGEPVHTLRKNSTR
jgi:DNA-binding protein HU-beta